MNHVERTYAEKLDALLEHLKEEVATNEIQLKLFSDRLARSLDGTEKSDEDWKVRDPYTVIDNANGLHQLACRHHVTRVLIEAIEKNRETEDYYEFLKGYVQEMIFKFTGPNRSSSDIQRSLSDELAGAWLDVHNHIRWL